MTAEQYYPSPCHHNHPEQPQPAASHAPITGPTHLVALEPLSLYSADGEITHRRAEGH